MFPQANADEFEHDGKIWRDRATGVEYVPVPGAPLASGHPKDLHIAAFIIVDGRLVFLRRRDDDGVERSVHIGTATTTMIPGKTPLDESVVDPGGPDIL